MKRNYTKEEVIKLLQDLYIQINKPITSKDIIDAEEIPKYGVFNRLFGSWQNACNEANIPFGQADRKGRQTWTNRLNEEKIDSRGCLMKIVEYNNAMDIVVEFQDEHQARIHTNYGNWKKNRCKNPCAKTIFNKGYLGNSVSKIDGVKKESYKVWYAMIQRCYKECYDEKPTYYPCEVCEEWLCYATFEKWYNENYYQVNNEVMHLDKDILFKGNKIYSPETCIFVPQGINKIFTKRDRFRGDYPIGVRLDKKSGQYAAFCNKFGKTIYLGVFGDPINAFKMYKKHKEKHIKNVAELYKCNIPDKLYKALYKYEVEITD